VSGTSILPRRLYSVRSSDIREFQKPTDTITAFFPRIVSPYVTATALQLGLSGNQVTILWGVVNVAASAVVYAAINGRPALVLLVFAMHLFAHVLDCSDGEVARRRQAANPIGGKLLDGICHKATEYSMLVAYIAAIVGHAPPTFVLAVSMALLTGEAMCAYAEERRILVVRLHAAPQKFATPTGPDDVYNAGESWSSFSSRKKVKSLAGLIEYKSVYAVIVLGMLSIVALAYGLVALALYKHYSWVRLISRTVSHPPAMRES